VASTIHHGVLKLMVMNRECYGARTMSYCSRFVSRSIERFEDLLALLLHFSRCRKVSEDVTELESVARLLLVSIHHPRSSNRLCVADFFCLALTPGYRNGNDFSESSHWLKISPSVVAPIFSSADGVVRRCLG
jgi:hypothetical protein